MCLAVFFDRAVPATMQGCLRLRRPQQRVAQRKYAVSAAEKVSCLVEGVQQPADRVEGGDAPGRRPH